MARQGDPADLKLIVLFLRSLRRWKQEDLSKASGVDRGLISDYELGAKAPTRKTLQRLADAVGLPFSYVERFLPLFREARLAVERGGLVGTLSPEAAELPGLEEGLDRAISEAVLPSLTPYLMELEAATDERSAPKAENRAFSGSLAGNSPGYLQAAGVCR